MDAKIDVKPQGLLSRTADVLMIPLMYLISGTFSERPQHGHLWNKKKLKREDVSELDIAKTSFCYGMPKAKSRLWCHFPILGGWRDYVTLEPRDWDGGWHVGWITDTVGMRRVVSHGRVRMLRARGNTHFFGIAAEGEMKERQIRIGQIGDGRIGDGGRDSHLPLL